MARGSGKLMRAALRFLRKTRKRARPDRMNPHFTTHTIGGGHVRMPGKVSLARHGVLFLDELQRFQRHVLEVLR